MTYHVGPNGKPSVCKAKKGNCPYESISPHFDTEEKAQQYSDNLNAFIAKMSLAWEIISWLVLIVVFAIAVWFIYFN